MKRLQLYFALAVIAGCASVGGQPAVSADDQRAIDTHLLLADLAIESRQLGTAADETLAAALLSSNPGVAERATRIAHELELTSAGVTAVERWIELAPEDERPYWFLGIFETNANSEARATAAFEHFVRGLGDTATGLALVLEALILEADTELATSIMYTLTETFPATGFGHYALARLALRSGDFELALENAAAATESDPQWIDAQLLHARTLLIAGRTDESIAIAARIAEQYDALEVQLQYAELLLSAGRTDEAEARLSAILETDPGLPEAVRALAFLSLTEERLDTAEEHFGTLRNEPRYRDEAFYYLGRISETRGDFFQARRSYARVIQGTHAVEAQLRTARIMFTELGDRDGAVRHLRSFGEANPLFKSDMLVAQSQLLLQMDRLDEAMSVFDEALAETPDDPMLRAAHVRLYILMADDAVSRGLLDQAETLLTRGLERYADDTSLRYSQALLYQRQGRMRKAADVLEALVDDHPDDPALLNALGYLLTDHFNRHDRARGYIQKALALNPDSPAIIDSMGWVLFKLGDYEAASEYLERAYRLEPDSEIAAHLVDVRWALGERDDALDLLRTASEREPESLHLREVSERLEQ